MSPYESQLLKSQANMESQTQTTSTLTSCAQRLRKVGSLDQSSSESTSGPTSGDFATAAEVTSVNVPVTVEQSPRSVRRLPPRTASLGLAQSPEQASGVLQTQTHAAGGTRAKTATQRAPLIRRASELSSSPLTQQLSTSLLQQSLHGTPRPDVGAQHAQFVISPGGSGQISPRSLAQLHNGSLTLSQWITGTVRVAVCRMCFFTSVVGELGCTVLV